MVGACQVCGTYTELECSGCCKPCSKIGKVLVTVVRQFMLRGRQPHIFDLAEAVGLDPSLIHPWVQQRRLGIAIKPNGGNGSAYAKKVSPNGVPRRGQAKGEHYWADASRVRRNAHRRTRLSEIAK